MDKDIESGVTYIEGEVLYMYLVLKSICYSAIVNVKKSQRRGL